MKLLFITGNQKKIEEARAILSEFDIEQKELDIPELQGEIHAIIKDKASKAAELTGLPCFVDDTSLCFNALEGLPGQYIKDFLTKLGREGLVKLLAAHDDKSANAVCMIGYCEPGHEPVIFEGITEGNIVDPRGKTEFGWDPIFEPKDKTQTYAEMPDEEKNSLSHRSKALNQFKEYLKKRGE